jgi:hypothetical protein
MSESGAYGRRQTLRYASAIISYVGVNICIYHCNICDTNEELNDLYSSLNIIRVIKSRKIRWADHIARMGKREVHTGFWWGNLREGDHLGDPGVDGRIILKWIFKTRDGAWTGLSWLRIGRGGGLL